MASDLLSKVPLFSKLKESERAELTRLMRARRYPAQQPVFWIDERGDEFFVIESGKAIITCPDESGNEMTLAEFGPGQFFGEVSLLDGGPRTATVRAASDLTLLSLGREDFLRFLEKHPNAAVHMLMELGARQRSTNEKIRGIQNVNQAVDESATRWQVVSEAIANFTATQWFVTGNILFCITWVVVNAIIMGKPFDKPPEFSVLALITQVEALFISFFVLISQSQQNVRDRIRADLDYQVNVKAHQEVMQLHRKVDLLQSTLKPRSEESDRLEPVVPVVPIVRPQSRGEGDGAARVDVRPRVDPELAMGVAADMGSSDVGTS
jgi:uncharacterized membrane protein